eukprot:TRINITY_DN5407_c0_g3_i1.p1 TRINITY_DN5407_c0_g3~~TRINITY_DN5407_c0_g3_i1.p1  ORF type:complete len:1008 (-),score=233.30 TRINITY_DN5407_c0_g3_i1:90-2789(-)
MIDVLTERWSTNDCVEKFGFALLRREAWYFSTIGPQVLIRYDMTKCITSARLDQLSEVNGNTCRDAENYGMWYVQASTDEFCLKDGYYCNWKNCSSLFEEDCKSECESSASSYFCGLCEDDQQCVEFAQYNDQRSCEQASVCVLPDGTPRPDLTEQECLDYGTCTELCEGETCISKSQCEKKSGSCSSDYYLANTIYPNATGICFSSLLSYDVPAAIFTIVIPGEEINSAPYSYCDYPEVQSSYTPAGCVVYPQNTKESCKERKKEQKQLKKDDVEGYLIGDNHYVWVDLPKSKEECLSYYQCKQRLFTTRNFLITRYNSKTESDCKYVGAEYGPVFEWTAGRWINGVMRKLTWQKRKFDNLYEWKQTLNFTTVANDIIEAVDFISTTQITTDAVCRYSRAPRLSNILLCNCYSELNDETSNDGPCGDYLYSNNDSEESSPLAVINVCQGNGVSLNQFNLKVQLEDDSVEQGCVVTYVFLVPIYQFEVPKDVQISSSIVPIPEYDEFTIVKNKHHYIVGQLIGDGLRLENQNNMKLRNVTLCFEKTIDRDDSDFVVYDVGVMSSNTFFPMGLVGTEYDNDTVCVTIPTIEDCTSSQDCIFMPILRLENYEDVDSFYNTAEETLLYILSGLYFLLLLAAIGEIGYILVNPKNQLKLQNIVQICVIVIAIIRGLYFVLVPSTHFFQDEDIANFVFIIIPTMVQLTLLIINVLIWAINAMNLRIKFYIPFTILNSILYLMFIVLIILFVTLPTSESNGCGGRATIEEDQTSKEVVKVVFFVALMVVALIMLMGLIIFGVRIYVALTVNGTNIFVVRKVFILAILISSSVIVMTLYLLLLTFLDIVSVYLTFCILIVIEIIPFFILLWLLDPRVHNKATPKRPTLPKITTASASASKSHSDYS